MRELLHDPLHAAIAEKLKALRLQAGLSQRALAALMECTDNVIVRLENGRRRLDLLEFYRMCAVLEVDPVEVFGELVAAFESGTG